MTVTLDVAPGPAVKAYTAPDGKLFLVRNGIVVTQTMSRAIRSYLTDFVPGESFQHSAGLVLHQCPPLYSEGAAKPTFINREPTPLPPGDYELYVAIPLHSDEDSFDGPGQLVSSGPFPITII